LLTGLETEKSILKLTEITWFGEGMVDSKQDIHHQLPLVQHSYHSFSSSRVNLFLSHMFSALTTCFSDTESKLIFTYPNAPDCQLFTVMIFCTTRFVSLNFVHNKWLDSEVKMRGRANKWPTTVLVEVLSTLYEPVMRKQCTIINVLFIFQHQGLLPKKMTFVLVLFNTVKIPVSRRESEW